MTSFQFCLPVSDVSEFILRFFLSQQQSTFLFFKDISCCRCAGEGGTGPWGCCSSSRWRSFAVFLYFDDSLYYNEHLSPEEGSSPEHLSSTYKPTLSFLPVSSSVMFCFIFNANIRKSNQRSVFYFLFTFLCSGCRCHRIGVL